MIFSTTIRKRAGFTLIELLLVIAIIAVISSLALVVVRGAQDEARRAATLTRASQIRTFLLDRLETYDSRKVPIDMSNYGLSSSEQRQIGQRIIGDLMLTEMPHPVFDSVNFVIVEPAELDQYPSQAFRDWIIGFQAQLNAAEPTRMLNFANDFITALEGVPPELPTMVERVRENFYISPGTLNPDYDLPAEYLYEILRVIDRDGRSGLEILTGRAVADFDNDGIPEISDAWGEPFGFQINFVEESLPFGFESMPDAIRDLANISFLETNNVRIELTSRQLY